MNVNSKLKNFVNNIQSFDFDAGKLKNIPNLVIILSILMSASALLQFFADLVLEILLITGYLPHHPFRIDFLFLTGISALISFHTLQGIRRKEIDVTQDSTQVSLLVEIGLVFGDLYYLLTYTNVTAVTLWMRLPFMILTTINIFIVIYIIYRLKLFILHRVFDQLKALWKWTKNSDI
jgi:hypothetical protein